MTKQKTKKEVACIIITMLEEERIKLLETNTDLIITSTVTEAGVTYTEFWFLDKTLQMRQGVICDFGKLMGNTNACKLFYLISMNYKAKLYINIGVAAGNGDFRIGDVYCITELQTICENNDTSNANLQIKGTGEIALDTYSGLLGSEILRENSQKLIAGIKSRAGDNWNKIEKNFGRYNKITNGKCITAPSVVKDETTKDKLNSIRKLDVVEMEAYYFNDWFNMYKNQNLIDKNAQILFLKSPSDTGKKEEKRLLEELGTRELAMSNLYLTISYLLCKLYKFDGRGRNAIKFWNQHLFNDCIDKNARNMSPSVLENYFNEIMYTSNNSQITFDEICKNVIEENSITIIEGDAGTGKSTLLGMIYAKLKRNHKILYVDLKRLCLDKERGEILYGLLYRLACNDKDIILLIDGLTGDYEEKDNEIMQSFMHMEEILSVFNNMKVSICIGNDISHSKWIKSRLNETDLTVRKNNDLKIHLLKINCYSEILGEIVEIFFNSDGKNARKARLVKEYIENNTIAFIDFRLLNMFKENIKLIESKTFYEFVLGCVTPSKRRKLVNIIVSGIEYSQYDSEYEPLYKNIYTRSLILSYAIFGKIKEKDYQYFEKNPLIFSDNINYFFAIQVKKEPKVCLKFLEEIDNNIEQLFAIKTQILYSLSNFSELTNEEQIKHRLMHEFNNIKLKFEEDETKQKFIAYRTIGIAYGKISSDSNSIVEINNKIYSKELLRRYNLYFHFLYYSQQEFCYEDLKEKFEEISFEIILATYNTLLRQIENSSLLSEHACLTLISFLEFSNELKAFPKVKKSELRDKLKLYLNSKTFECEAVKVYANKYINE